MARILIGNYKLVAFALALPCLFVACAGDEKAGRAKSGGEIGGDGGGKGGDDKDGKPDAAAYVSSNKVTFSNSMSNNPLTSQTINRGKAEGQFEALAQAKDKKSLEGRIAAARLAGKSVNVVMQAAKKMAELEMIKSPNKDVDEEVRLEVALAAIGSRDFALAEYFLDELSESKNAKVKAAALNAFGVVALRDDRVPEAVLYFRQSLKALPGYRPAVLNLGFTALKGGELATAKRELSQMQNDWFVQYGLISVERMAGDVGSASSLCERVLKKEANHKAALYNCGLLEFQNKKQYKKALELVNKAARAPGGEAGWAERIQATETRIDQEQARAGAGGAGGNAKGPGKGK